MVKRKLLVGTVVLILVCTLFPQGFGSAETSSSSIEQKKEDIKERDKKIQQLEKKKKLAEQDQKDILAKIEETKSKLYVFDQKVYELQEKVNRGEEELKELEAQIADRKENFNNRLRSIYMQGDMFYLETLLESQSFGDFLKRLDFMIMLTRADRQMMDNYKEDQKKLQAAQDELNADLADLEKQKAAADQIYQDLQGQYSEHKQVLASITHNLAVLEEENEKDRKELAALVAKATQEARERERERELAGRSAPVYTGGKFYWPVDGGKLTSPFGMRWGRMHEGIDIGAEMGTPIKAAAPGEVIESRPSSGYGYIIVIYHGDGLATLYAHMYAQTVKVQKGQKVVQGQVIAAVGSNGRSTGPHLHFEVHKNGSPVDPMPYFR